MTIDWEQALAPATGGRRSVAPASTSPAVKQAPFRTCSRCGKGFQRWPLDAEGRPCDALECPRCRSTPAAVKAELEQEKIAAEDVAIPY